MMSLCMGFQQEIQKVFKSNFGMFLPEELRDFLK
jgi:hypothetical protein